MATCGENIRNKDISSDIDVGCATLRSCEPCMKDNTSKDATQFCSVCAEFLCDDCKRGHSRFKAGNHSFINATEVTDVPVVVDMKDIDKCEEHKKKLKFFCKDHSLLCCSTCAFIHRTCKSVDEIAKISDKMRENLKELHDSLVKIVDREQRKIEDCTQTVKTLEDKVTEFKKTIDSKKGETIKLFDDAKSRITNEANIILATESERLDERKMSAKNTLKKFSEILQICLRVMNNGTSQQTFILVKYIANKLKDNEIYENEQKKNHFSMQLSVAFTKETKSLLGLGPAIVKLIDERQNINTVSPSPTVGPTIQTSLSLKPLKTLDFKIAAMDFLPDKRLVVAYADRECVVMDEQLQKLGTPFCLSYDPAAVVCMSNTEVAIPTNFGHIVILCVSQNNIITLTRSFSTKKWYGCFCMVDSTTIFAVEICTIKCAKISILDGSESLFNNLQCQTKEKGLFSNCAYLQCSDKVIMVDNHVSFRVLIFDAATGTYTDVNVHKDVLHVCPGPDNTALVFCDDRIVTISHDGKVLSTCNMIDSRPVSICVSKDFTRLALSTGPLNIKLMELKIT